MAEFCLTQEYVKSVFFLDEDGELYWREDGSRADSPRGKYLAVKINGVRYYSHHVVWLYAYGYVLKNLDHWDGDERNNRLGNLRKASGTQNNANSDHGTYRGVEAHGAKYRARIWVDNERISLGSYSTIEEAIEAYQAGAIKYFGEFAYCMRVA